MPLTHRENFLRNASLQGHEWIPSAVCFASQMWYELREELEDICIRHQTLFPGFKKGSVNFDGWSQHQKPQDRVDEWGCRWQYELAGLEGQVVGHPLENWDAFEEWKKTIPKPLVQTAQQRTDHLKCVADARARGDLVGAGLNGHGFFFMRLYYLRRFENLMLDMALEDPRLDELIEILAAHYESHLAPWLETGLDLLTVADDLGTQTASMTGPRHFRRYLMPTYKRLFLAARQRGAHVYMHHDGYILDIADELLESGVSIVNPQDLANGIDNIARVFKGRACIECDIDRQQILPYGSPNDVHELIKEEVMKLGSPRGGLSFICGVYWPTPAENINALCDALEEYRTYWVGR